jgi:hypothetical protein
MRIACLACLAVAACSSHSPPGGGANPVALTVVGSPALVAVRDGGGDWREVSGTDGNLSFGVDYDYTLLVTCTDQTGFDTVLRARTTDDGDQFIYCDGHATAFADSVPVTGTMQQAGTVSLYDIQQSTTAPWNFTLAVPPGTGDLVAVDSSKAMIRRDLAIAGPMQIPPIDVERDGTPLVPVALALDGIQPGEQLTTEIDLYSRNSIAWGPTVEGATAQMLPSSLLRPDDDVDLYLEAWGAPYFRTIDTTFDGTVTRFQMMAPISGVEFTPDGGASWSQLPPHTAVALELTAGNSAQRVSASESWLSVNGETTLGLDSFGALPARFQNAWRLDLSQPYERTFSAVDDATPIATSSGISEDVGSLQRSEPQDLPVHVAARRVDRRVYEQARHRAVAKP